MQAEDGGAAEASGGVTGRAEGRQQQPPEGPPPEGEPRTEGTSGGRRKAKWKLKFHHQALPPEYLDHYEAALALEAARGGGGPAQQRPKPRKGPQGEAGPAEVPAAESKPPRRGRKPKKADICHVVSGGGAGGGGSLLARRLTQGQEEPLNLCIRDLGRVRVKEEPPEAAVVAPEAVPLPPEAVCWSPLFVHPIALQAPPPGPHLLLCDGQPPPAPPPPRAKRPAPAAPGGRRKRSAIFIPPTTADNATEVSICKFKFTGGARPSLEEKKMLSVDAGGNLRFYSGGDKGGGFFPTTLPAPSPPRPQPPPPPEEGPSSNAADEGPSTTTGAGAGRRKRRTRKSLARERLEQTFREKGFLIQTQQLESAEGATYCKFRQLRKFTRYLFRSWKDYLPGSVKEMTGTPPGPEPRPPHQ
ncbi:basic proline-rich protein [Ischnura elegans]|uniref:basic proline-rich protein n=1 Tax=Ischnura elegans TaxID=197161 RepID=UPI001ED88E7C|nr:basic proline-rich protein [Ischnura elegans]XP_046394518.1 basic proline-rich protein [Ischnura elegans]XP_046394519.1 basic proline-rich protein [Ischnura elegans]